MSFTYKGLQAKFTRHVVTEEEVQMQLLQMQQSAPRYTEITDRPTENGDEVILDYAGFCDGEQFAGGTAENQTLVLGSGTFIPGFEEQLVGKQIGEAVTVSVTFPEQYHSEALAGKAAEFKCTIHQIRQRGSYELDDTFAREIGGCENLEQMRQRLAQSMQAYADERSEMELQDQLLRQAADTLELQIRDEDVEPLVDRYIEGMAKSLAQQGLSLEAYYGFTGTNEETLRQEAREDAEGNLRLEKTIERIAREEALTASEEEIQQALNIICRDNGMTPEQIKPYIDEEFQKAVVRSVLASKVMLLIRESAIVE